MLVWSQGQKLRHRDDMLAPQQPPLQTAASIPSSQMNLDSQL
jgi:hypothetical protein